MRVGAGVGHLVADVRDPSRERDPFFHRHLRQFHTAGPVPWQCFSVKLIRLDLKFQNARSAPAPVTPLHRIPAPQLFIPERSVHPAIIGLLNQATAVPVIDEVARRTAGGKPADTRAG